jgi:hypothetical protein
VHDHEQLHHIMEALGFKQSRVRLDGRKIHPVQNGLHRGGRRRSAPVPIA